MVAKYCDEHVFVCVRVCLSVCLRAYFRTTHTIFTNFAVHVAYGRGSAASGRVTKSQEEWAILRVVQAIQKH